MLARANADASGRTMAGGHNCQPQPTDLILLALLLALALGRLGADLLVVLLEGSEVLAGLAELALLHALADVPVHEGALGVHEVELVVDARVELGDRGRVGHHRDGAHDLGEVTARHDGRGLVVDAALEAGRAPVDELDGALRLDGGDGGVDVLGDDVAAVHRHTAMYLPWRGSTLQSIDAGSKAEL